MKWYKYTFGSDQQARGKLSNLKRTEPSPGNGSLAFMYIAYMLEHRLEDFYMIWSCVMPAVGSASSIASPPFAFWYLT